MLIRAPLVHYYYELIHPFWDGNGRVGRVIEATLLLAEGYEYAPFAQARYYLNHFHHYLALFNSCRRLAENKEPAPNIPLVAFFLEGMLASINALHDRVNRLISVLLFESDVRRALDARRINHRQTPSSTTSWVQARLYPSRACAARLGMWPCMQRVRTRQNSATSPACASCV